MQGQLESIQKADYDRNSLVKPEVFPGLSEETGKACNQYFEILNESNIMNNKNSKKGGGKEKSEVL